MLQPAENMVDRPNLVPMLCKCCSAVFLGWLVRRSPLESGVIIQVLDGLTGNIHCQNAKSLSKR